MTKLFYIRKQVAFDKCKSYLIDQIASLDQSYHQFP